MINSPVATSGERRAGREGAGLLNAGTRLIPRVLSRDPFFISQREKERERERERALSYARLAVVSSPRRMVSVSGMERSAGQIRGREVLT